MANDRLFRPLGAPSLRVFVVIALVLVLSSCVDGGHITLQQPTAGDGTTLPAPDGTLVADSVLLGIERDGSAEALVLLDTSFVVGASASSAAERVRAVADVQALVLDSIPQGALSDVRLYKYFPVMYAAMNAKALVALMEHPAVLEIAENRVFYRSVAQSLSLIRQPEVVAAGHRGAGTAVAVLDTGTDYRHSVFGSCSAPGTSGCRVAFARDFAPDDGQLDAHGHGTNVSGIVASVAPGTQILDLDVFQGSGAASNVILDALEWVITNRATYNVVAVNMSLGAGLYSGSCASDVFAATVQAVRDAGILPVVASGNDGSSGAIASPACVPAALSVGAVYDANVGGRSYPGAGCSDASPAADMMACFSNSSSQLSMLAPGASITAADIEMSGTSQAAPHVAGAAAVLAAAYPSEGPSALFTRLTESGPVITDARNGIARRRLDLTAALALDLGGSGPTEPTPEEPTPEEPTPEEPTPEPPADDIVGPTATITIDEGAYAVATNRVTLTIDAADPSGVASMCISNTTRCGNYVAFQPSVPWTLRRGNGLRRVLVRLRDGLGNVGGPYADTIIVDRAAPRNGAVSVEPGDGSVRLTMTGATDAVSNPLSYVVVGGPGQRAPRRCTVGTELYSGDSPTALIEGLTNGVQMAMRMCVRDALGNMSVGVAVTAVPAPEFDPPTGTVTIDDGADNTTARTVSLTIDAQDESGIALMCISTGRRCTRYVPFTPTTTFTLPRSSGLRSVYVYLRDVWGNQTPIPLSDSILVDRSPPSNGKVSVVAGDASVEITMTGARDALSSNLTYVVVGVPGTRAARTCGSGTEYYRGTSPTATLTGLTNGETLSLRMCVIDEFGNMSRGVAVITRPAPEFDPPTGTVVIEGGAAYAPSRVVNLTLTAQDNSNVAWMCISGRARCTRYVPFSTTATGTLGRSNGLAAIYVYFKDEWGNQATDPATDTIIVDTAPPLITSFSAVQNGSGRLDLTWAARDLGIGLAGVTLQYVPGRTVPASCNSGTRLYAGTGTSFSHVGLAPGYYSYRLCATDQFGKTRSQAVRAVIR